MRTTLYLPLLQLLLATPTFADVPVSLEQFLREAQDRNLSLKAESASSDAAKEESVGIALPPPMAAISQMSDQSGKATNWEVSQSIPFPTKLSNDHDARNLMAESRSAMLATREREVTFEARFLYFQLWKSQERTRLLKEKAAAIAEHLRLARAATRSDSFLKIHQLNAESELDLLENEITQSEQEQRDRQIAAAEFLNQDPKAYRPIAAEFAPSVLPKEPGEGTASQIQAKRFELESLQAREREAKASWLPDFNLRYREVGGTSMNPRYTEAMIGISLPFAFFWEPRSASGKASAERYEAEMRLEQEQRRIGSQRETLLTKAEALRKQLDQFQKSLIPRAEQRLRLVHNLAPRDFESLQEHREAIAAFPELKLKALDLREQYEETVANIEKIGSSK
jgi:cobalt-zinc-cadmium efflux system outer membrane protein